MSAESDGEPANGEPYDYTALHRALGRVASESARLEEQLRFLMADLTVDHDVLWLVWEGQATSWLLTAAKAIIAGRMDTYMELPAGKSDRITVLLAEAKALSELRNQVIHGTWSLDDDWDDAAPRPWGSEIGDDGSDVVLLCFRSRRMKEWDAGRWTVSDVEELADRCASLVDRLRIERQHLD